MRSSRRQFLALAVGAPAVLAVSRPATAAPAVMAPAVRLGAAAVPIHGINPADMDFSASPRDDFYRYANGGWMDRVTIPDDKSRYGVLTELQDRTSEQLLALLGDLADSSDLVEGSDEWKAVQLFRQGTDLATRNEQGITPIEATIDGIHTIQDLADLHAFFRKSEQLGVVNMCGVTVAPDLSDSMVHSLYMDGPSLGMPNRDFYLEDTEANLRAREAYIATCAALLEHAGHDPARAPENARAVFEFERQLAAETLTREEQQDFSLINNRMPVDELAELYP